jgi:2-phospho-L-lactate/phosphoenolpyruvate guanylyltransferase
VESAVLIPVKAFRDAKGRLAGRLTPTEREALARLTASIVARAAAPLPVAVVCDDDEVATWARSIGAHVLWTPEVGLNAAVADGVSRLIELGVEHVVVAHGDLPLAAGLAELAVADTIILVPDANDGGTNVISVPTECGFVFDYGPGSYRRHLAEAERSGLPVTVRRLAHLALDIDTPDDLDHPLLQEVLSSLRTNPANPA